MPRALPTGLLNTRRLTSAALLVLYFVSLLVYLIPLSGRPLRTL